jgi:hypothetical protein
MRRFPSSSLLRVPALAAALAASLLAADARSQDAKDLARARERFKEGAALQSAGDFARALEAYKDVALVKSSAQVRFNIATCEEKLGDYVRAMGSYRFALTEATRSNTKNIEEAVTKALADLEPRIPMLLVKRGQGAAVAEVTLDGRALANPSIGVEFQVNPGPHAVKATAPDREPLTVEMTLADRDHKVVEIVLKPVAKAAPVVVVPVVEEPPPPPPPRSNRMLIGGIATGGAGVLLLVISGVYFGMRQSAISTLNGECGAGGMHCPPGPGALSTYNSGQSDATVSAATFGVGLAALAAGGTVIVLATRNKTPPPAAGLVLTPGGGGVYGAF